MPFFGWGLSAKLLRESGTVAVEASGLARTHRSPSPVSVTAGGLVEAGKLTFL